MDALVDSGAVAELVQFCEQKELEEEGVPPAQRHLPPSFFAVFLSGLLIQNDLNNARFLWKRLRTPDEETTAVWRIGQALWKRQYPEVYVALHKFAWSPIVAKLIGLLEAAIRNRMLTLLATAYTTISLVDAAAYLGLDAQQCLALITQKLSWSIDATGTYATPKRIVSEKQQSTDLDQLNQLTDYVLHLERST